MILPFPADDSIPIPVELRTCRLCGQPKPLATDYYFTKKGKPIARCKECTRATNAVHHGPRLAALRQATAERRANAPPVEPPTVKFCRGCKVDKPIGEFFSPRGRKYSRCYSCVRDQNTKFMEANREECNRRAAENTRARRKADPAFRERERASQARYLADHPIPPALVAFRLERKKFTYRFDLASRLRTLEAVRRYREKHPEKIVEIARNNYRRNKQKYFAHNHNRRARKRGNGGKHTAEQWEALKAQYGHRCLKCGRAEPEITLTRDHIVPIVRGGSNDISNLQPLCLRDNLRKGTRTIDYRPKARKPPAGTFAFMAD